MASEVFGKLVIVSKDGAADSIEFPIDKKEHSCDIRIVNKEISRKHAEVYVEDTGVVFINSMGREPVRVNGAPVTSPQELASGDKIEVQLESRTRVFYYYGEDETVQINEGARGLLSVLNGPKATPRSAAKPQVPAGGPPPPPPPLPPPGFHPSSSMPAPQPPPLSRAAAPAAAPGGLGAALQNAIKAGVQLKKVAKSPKPAGPPPPAPGGPFVPNASDLLKLKAALRKTAPAAEECAAEPEAAEEQPAAEPALAEELAAAEECSTAKEAGAEVAAAEQPAAEPMEPEDPAAEPHAVAQELAPAEGPAAEAAAPGAAVGAPGDEAPMEADMAAEPAAMEADVGVEPAAMESSGAMESSEPLQSEGTEAALAEPEAEALEEVGGGEGVPASVLKKRKSVRFNVQAAERMAGTPEGAPCDATITIRLRRGELEQIINVDDSTVAFSQWGLGTMHAEDAEELPDTVVSKRSRPSMPGSVGRTPVQANLREAFAQSPMPSIVMSAGQPTPGAAGAKAPAPTPASVAPSAGRLQGSALAFDPSALASKLAEMVGEEREVTLELPAEFFKGCTPNAAPGSQQGLRLVLTPRSTAKACGAEASARSAPRSTGRSRLAQEGHLSDAEPLEAEFLLERTEEIAVPAELLAAAAAAAAAATPAAAAAAVAVGASARKSGRRSSSRTPGTKIVIVEKRTPSQPGSAPKSVPRTAVRAPGAEAATQTSPPKLSTVGMQVEAEDSGNNVEADISGSLDGSLEEEAAAAEVAGDMVPKKEWQRMLLRAKSYHKETRQLAAQLRRATAKAAKLKGAADTLRGALQGERAKRAELQEKLQQVVLARAASEAEAEQQQEEEEGMEEAEEVVAEEQQPDGAAAPAVRVVVCGPVSQAVTSAERAGEVVVVRPTAVPVPAAATVRKTPAPSARKARTPAPSALKAGTPLGLPRSMLKTTPGTASARVVLDNVEMPEWLFEGDCPAAEVAAAEEEEAAQGEEEAPAAGMGEEEEVAEVEVEADINMIAATVEEEGAAAEEVEEQGERDAPEAAQEVEMPAAMEVEAAPPAPEPQQAAELHLEAEAEAEEDEEEGEEDVCHICGESDEGDVLLLCDSCDNACHLACCNPPLKRIPKGDWFCIECVARQQAAAAAIEAAAAQDKTKHGGKNGAAAEESEPAHKAARGGKKGAAPAAQPQEEQEGKAGRGRGAKRAAEQAEAEPATAAARGGGKRARAAEPAPCKDESAPPTRSRGIRQGKQEEAAEVSTRRGRTAAAKSEPASATAGRSTRARK